MTSQPSLRSLQCGRGLAAMAVVAFHLSLLLADPRYLGQPVLLDFTRRGNLGVDFFFVLSGFIILFAHGRDIGQPERLRGYLLKRFTRLYPAYWLYTAIFCSLVAVGVGSASTLPASLTDWISTVFLLRIDNFELPIVPAWTLIHEVAFYLVFSLLIVNRKLGIAAIALWMLPLLFLFEHREEGARSALTTYFSPLNLNFLIGMGACLLYRRLGLSPAKGVFAGGLAAFAATYAVEANGLSYDITQILYALSFGAIIAGAAAWERERRQPVSFGPLQLIGDASYSIYLTHLAFLGLFSKIMMKLQGFVGLGPHVFYAIVFCLTVAAGCFLYVFVEKPLLNICRRLLEVGRRQPAGAAA
ncbi:acyltransferase [Corticibacterium sp. UT-5YL-CI-8]|nr:acyltransferase [Tianweitania sp. UT-5YL-CI-8]